MNSTHYNAYRNLLFKVIHWCRRTVCSKFPSAVQSYPKCWGNVGQQYFSFKFILNFMPYSLSMENIIIHNKTHDMLPSISSTILHVRYSEHANSKIVQSSPIWRYWFTDNLTLGENFMRNCIESFSMKEMHLKMSSAKCQPLCSSFYVLFTVTSIYSQ